MEKEEIIFGSYTFHLSKGESGWLAFATSYTWPPVPTQMGRSKAEAIGQVLLRIVEGS